MKDLASKQQNLHNSRHLENKTHDDKQDISAT